MHVEPLENPAVNTTQEPRRALILCYSNLEADPRVTRQIDWLTEDGWTVDTLGLGRPPRKSVHRHFQLIAPPSFTEPRAVKGLIHLLLPYKARFHLLVGSQVPKNLYLEAPESGYDLVLVNDIDLLPWVHERARRLLSRAADARIHLDVHEYHYWAPESQPSRITRFLLAGYHKWMTGLIASPVVDSRSTVADGIADLYAEELGVPRPAIVRNSLPFVNQEPSPVDPEKIDLVYHGNAEMARGLETLILAFRKLQGRFRLNLMLTGSAEGKSQLRTLTEGITGQVHFIEPVAMSEVAHRLNEFDLEVIFYPPTSPNFLHSFPNKFFEAVQGRLGLIVGESPSMAGIIANHSNGLVVRGWTADDLASSINALSAADIQQMKQASGLCAGELNSEREKAAFLSAITEPMSK